MTAESLVIRFKCPNCGRLYQVSPVLSHVPLLCKGCGQRVAVPETSLEPEPPPEPVLPEPTKLPSVSETSAAAAMQDAAEKASAVAAAKAAARPEEQTAPHPTDEAAPPEGEESPERKKPLAIFVDAMLVLFFLLIGGMLGEILAKKSTGEVLSDASTAAKFPPLELLLWLAPPAMLILIYSLLISRRKSLGAWLQRKSES